MVQSKIKKVYDLIAPLFRAVIAYPLGRLCYSNKHIWLIGERPGQAQDNGYHFFKYLKAEHPEQRAYYVIKKNAPKRTEIAEIGETILYGSFKHWMMYFGADALISSHIRSLVPTESWFYNKISTEFDRKSKTQVFLQHGVISADIPSLYSERTKVDLFICGAKPEYDYVREHFHYKNNEVVYTGLARYDALHDFTVKKQILIMPTWRTWLKDLGTELKNSEYIHQWNQVITDDAFIKAAKETGYRIIFYPHPNMQRNRDCFVSKDEALIIADEQVYEIQTLLKESALLITDFSSVFFDFAYMRKPMLFFQFDKERHAAEHYHKGYFDYERDGFGKVAYTAPDLVEDFKEMLKNGVALSEKYDRRINRFFPLFDKKNCERIYQAIAEMKKSKS